MVHAIDDGSPDGNLDAGEHDVPRAMQPDNEDTYGNQSEEIALPPLPDYLYEDLFCLIKARNLTRAKDLPKKEKLQFLTP